MYKYNLLIKTILIYMRLYYRFQKKNKNKVRFNFLFYNIYIPSNNTKTKKKTIRKLIKQKCRDILQERIFFYMYHAGIL